MKIDSNFEWSKLKTVHNTIFLIAFLSQLVFLFFFATVGHFESGDTSSNILKNIAGIGGLASTITMCILAIYGATLVNSFIIENYIGENRVRVYLYPYGRKNLFLLKIKTFVLTFLKLQLLGLLLSDTIFLIGEFTFPIVNSKEGMLSNLLIAIISSITSALITLVIILLSGVVGIRYSSLPATIVSSIVLVVILGNLIAMSLAAKIFLSLIIALSLTVLLYFIIQSVGERIENEEVV
ncbi:hypothetical protein [Niallia taxi]|uniref:hypothetical protein n=1 Tax=Niallia taxi TaxID=2499688 RepID=UPI0011A6DAE5|nr:hypothetical protein [Niallia taxi]MCT2344517.1 hypothetical protein [Niallia taxi]MDE5054338.1 hypothetical protein [Niallia taxi]MED4035957.1 hypothetical protein [Niallia taxi]WOD65125.1 hypothetical protein NQZ71_24765 [Niallia taxi]